MNNNTIIGLDIAKNIFHLVSIDENGQQLNKKRLKRTEIIEYFANLEKTTIALEACGGSNFWGRKFTDMGHLVKIIPAEKVKPYLLKKQKNDYNDARAIAEAASRKNIRCLSPGTVEQQDLQMLIRTRDLLVKQTTAISNQIRGFLTEYGLVCKKGISNLINFIKQLKTDPNYQRFLWKVLIRDLYYNLKRTLKKVSLYDRLVGNIVKQNEDAVRLMRLKGIGPVTALATIALVNNINDFKNGRHFSANLGIVPRQHSTGGKNKLFGITKRGDAYLRKLLVHGARASLQYVTAESDPWLFDLKLRRGYNKAAVAQANKTARLMYAVLKHKDNFNFEQHCRA